MPTALEIFNTVIGVVGTLLGAGSLWQAYSAQKAATMAKNAAFLAVKSANDANNMFGAERFIEKLSALKSLHMLNASNDYLRFTYDELSKELIRFGPIFLGDAVAQKAVTSLLTNLRAMESIILGQSEHESVAPKKRLSQNVSKDVDVLLHCLTNLRTTKQLEVGRDH